MPFYFLIDLRVEVDVFLQWDTTLSRLLLLPFVDACSRGTSLSHPLYRGEHSLSLILHEWIVSYYLVQGLSVVDLPLVEEKRAEVRGAVAGTGQWLVGRRLLLGCLGRSDGILHGTPS